MLGLLPPRHWPPDGVLTVTETDSIGSHESAMSEQNQDVPEESTNQPADHPDARPQDVPADSGPPPTGERRKRQIPVAVDRRRAQNAAEKRRTSERRRLIDPTTCERDYSDDETEFMKAIEQYKRENRRPFPTWSEVLEIVRALGYRKVAEAGPLPGKSTPMK